MPVKIWTQTVSIPTYCVGPRDKNPMFLEKRVYQGSSGRVYPWPVIDKIADEKTQQEYCIVYLENEYLQVQVMPELGGRIYRAVDKTNGYDFVYYNRVIKPALVGLAGPWVSGGIEFNWPQHHRPNTFGKVEYLVDDTEAARKTVWLAEQDRMYGTRMSMGVTLREGVAAIEISGVLYNPTSEAQTFLWWANPAVAVHDDTQSIFPPDVHAVMDHGKRDVSRFPIATGTYYKMDYSKGVDISRYKNIPVPTSYMAYYSGYDFVGGYDYKAGAGILHVADHHISPGKKQWTWGNGAFGQAWDRNLTDEDGPYIELMTGVFTDNQPDFTWLAPHSGKNFTQYFMPYKTVGKVKCASADIVAGLDVEDGRAVVRVYATRRLEGAVITLKAGGKTLLKEQTGISPVAVFEKAVGTAAPEWEHCLLVEAPGVKTLCYTPEEPAEKSIPAPAKAIGAPESLPDAEALLLAGLHLEQYRHATYEPDAYYREGLKRQPDDMRLNNAYGSLLLRRGQFEEAQALFETAKETATRHSPNPYDGEVFYNLGRALEMQGRDAEAFDAYYKAIWSDAWRSQGYLKLAQIAARRNEILEALGYAKEALWAGYKNFDARMAVTVLQRLAGDTSAAIATVKETQGFDPMDRMAASEAALLEPTAANRAKLAALLGGKAHNAMALANAYMALGQHKTAIHVLESHISGGGEPYAMLWYYLAACKQAAGMPGTAAAWKDAQNAPGDYCFPNMLEEYRILRQALRHNPDDAMARYYMGCFLYDKKRHDDACAAFCESAGQNPGFATVHRNLALYYANRKGDYAAARRELEMAFRLDESDARIFYELCELYKKIGLPLQERCRVMEAHKALVEKRDDLSVAYAEVLNGLGRHEEVVALLLERNFHPWEGGEGKVPTQHIEARLALARQLLAKGENAAAIEHLEKAMVYFPNFGEGKLTGAQENNVHYTLGLAWQALNAETAATWFEKAATGLAEPAGAMYYNDQPPHMIYYQGMALLALGRKDEAHARFNKLITYGKTHLREKQVMDYFAVSLPDFLVFETDLDDKNRVHCHYMMGLGYMGLEEADKAREAFDAALAIMPGHCGALCHRGML